NFGGSPAFQNSGTVAIGSGSTLQSDVPLANAAGGVLSGFGTFAGNIQNAGTVSPGASPGLLTINGNYAQTTGALAVELNGTTVGTQYDQLKVNGTVSLAGALNLTAGFAPPVGTQFTILNNTGGALTGSFANLPQGA